MMERIKSKWDALPKGIRIIGYILLGGCAIVAISLVCGFAIQLLWNWLMTDIFSLKPISFWQALGIFVLARFIFGIYGKDSEEKETSKKRHKKPMRAHVEGLIDEQKEDDTTYTYYDTWWEQEGKKSFDHYVEENKENDET